MRLIKGPKGSGKTEELLKLADSLYDSGCYYIVTSSHYRAKELFNRARDSGYSIMYPICAGEIVSGQYEGSNIDGFLMDNADLVLPWFFRGARIIALEVDDDPMPLDCGVVPGHGERCR